MNLTDDDIQEFKKVYAEEFGETISDDEALEMGGRVMRIVELVLQSPPKAATQETDPPRTQKPYWQTRSIYLGAYVLAKGGVFIKVESQHTTPYFIFQNSEEVQRLAKEYLTADEALVDARQYVEAMDKLYRAS